MEVEEAEGTESRSRDDKSIRVPEIIKAIPHISLSLSLSLSAFSSQFWVLGFWVVGGFYAKTFGFHCHGVFEGFSRWWWWLYIIIMWPAKSKSFRSIVVVRSLRKRKVASSILAGSFFSSSFLPHFQVLVLSLIPEPIYSPHNFFFFN